MGQTLPAGNVINNNGTLTINGTGTTNSGQAGSGAYSGVISGSGNVVISGGGSTTFSGANTYGGATAVNGGTFVPSFNGALPPGSPIILNSPGIFDLCSVNESIASLASTGTVNLESGTLTVGGGNTSTVFSGAIQNAAAAYNNGASVNGLQGFYFPNYNLSGTPVIRVDSTVNFANLATNTQPLYPQVTQFSVRWIGQLLTTGTGGTYTFTTTSDDGSRLWVNGVLVVDNWNFQPPTARSGTISLAANTKYDIRLEYEQGGGGAECLLAWTPPGGSSAIIPSANLFTYAGVGGLVKTGSGALILNGTNTYAGTTAINAGALALGGTGSINNSSSISIGAGATFDISALASYTLSGSAALSASGTASPATIKGGATVNLGSGPITLTYDGLHPALTISQGALILNGNPLTVNGPLLAGGAYTLVQQAGGNVGGSVNTTVTGTAIPASGAIASVLVAGGSVMLMVIYNTIPVTITSASLLANGTVQLYFTGTPQYTYTIQTTTNLAPPIIWTAIGTNTADTNGLFNFIDSNAVNDSQRFYRTVAH